MCNRYTSCSKYTLKLWNVHEEDSDKKREYNGWEEIDVLCVFAEERGMIYDGESADADCH